MQDALFPFVKDKARYFTLQGTKGILQLGDANQFGGELRFLPNDPRNCEWKTLPPVSSLSDNCRGLGPADMARCIRLGGTHLTSAEMACHVLDVVEQIMRSGETGLPCDTSTSCRRPAAFADWESLLRQA